MSKEGGKKNFDQNILGTKRSQMRPKSIHCSSRDEPETSKETTKVSSTKAAVARQKLGGLVPMMFSVPCWLSLWIDLTVLRPAHYIRCNTSIRSCLDSKI